MAYWWLCRADATPADRRAGHPRRHNAPSAIHTQRSCILEAVHAQINSEGHPWFLFAKKFSVFFAKPSQAAEQSCAVQPGQEWAKR